MLKSLLRFFEKKEERPHAVEAMLAQEALDLFEVDPYLHFNGPLYNDTPKEFIPDLDTIRRESEWHAKGLSLRRTKDGAYRPIVRKGLYFGFSVVVLPNEIEILAIKTKKKCTTDPASVAEFILHGCSYSDFACVTEDVKLYCEALQASDAQDALNKIKRASELKPDENLYADFQCLHLGSTLISLPLSGLQLSE